MRDKINTVLVDDEIGALEAIEAIITRLAPELNIIGKAQSVQSAFDIISSSKPELVFLDIQLKGQTGFDLLEMNFDFRFEVVFVTAYDEYAIKAFEKNALSYLLKPVGLEDFKRVKERILQVIENVTDTDSDVIETVLEGRLAIPNGSVVDYVDPSQIMYLKADGSYCEIFLSDNNKIVVSKPLSLLERKLDAKQFFRPHRSYIVSKTFITRWNKADGGWLIMENHHQVPISRSGRQIVEKLLSE